LRFERSFEGQVPSGSLQRRLDIKIKFPDDQVSDQAEGSTALCKRILIPGRR
jgi:hypothetical protein